MKKRIWLRLLSGVLVAAVMVMIYRFSAQTSTESNGLSKEIVRYILEFLGMYTDARLNSLNLIIRKAAHFSIYFLLGGGLACLLEGEQKWYITVLICVVIGGIFATTDEIHQNFTSRKPSALDVLLDTCGVAVGTSLVTWLLYRRKKNA